MKACGLIRYVLSRRHRRNATRTVSNGNAEQTAQIWPHHRAKANAKDTAVAAHTKTEAVSAAPGYDGPSHMQQCQPLATIIPWQLPEDTHLQGQEHLVQHTFKAWWRP
eukprot:CAMPEP_0172906578 /NCGR_PEP_ID=MMETSP1075-20121228/177139_1 /TAXON_ID=2916 /ORGANISM="Ceratium fusus, Strain PA161109" /LENGTH=107 /DNA_ID=CAMNT_0013764047 /DNA_START=199 /DNA_END=520 /DNA_ORIENTATION=+